MWLGAHLGFRAGQPPPLAAPRALFCLPAARCPVSVCVFLCCSSLSSLSALLAGIRRLLSSTTSTPHVPIAVWGPCSPPRSFLAPRVVPDPQLLPCFPSMPTSLGSRSSPAGSGPSAPALRRSQRGFVTSPGAAFDLPNGNRSYRRGFQGPRTLGTSDYFFIFIFFKIFAWKKMKKVEHRAWFA